MPLLSRADISGATFGGFDGAVSLLGLLAGEIVAHASGALVLTTAAGLAIAATVSMAAGEYLSDVESGGRTHRALVMGTATFVGSLLPALPFALMGGVAGMAASVVLVLLLGVLIAEVRPGGRGGRYAVTFALLAVASLLSVGGSLLAEEAARLMHLQGAVA